MASLGRGAARAGAAPEVGDESETDACDPCRSLEMKQLFGEFRMLYQERLHQLEIMDDAQEEVLRMKVRLLQSYVVDLSDQNNVLVQMMEELERETEWKVAALEAELQEYVARVTEHKQENSTLQITKAELQKEISRPSLAQRLVPTEHLSGSTATQITVTPPEQMIEQEELRVQMASKEQLIHQLNVHLREANHSQEKSKAEVLEKEVKIQELQEIITDLHHEISLKDSETVNQLQEKHLLETTVQSLRQLLDAQEQRIYQVQTKQTARQAELEQKCSWIQQLEQDLEASRRLQEESQRQLGECHVPLAQVAGENEALQSQQLLETETLMSSLRTWEKASGSLSCEMPEHQWEEQAELQQRLADVQDELQKKEAATHRLQAELQDAGLLTQEAKTQLAEAEKEVVTMRSKYSKAQKEAAERSEALQSLQEARQVLKLRTAEQEGTIRTLEGHRTKDLEKLQDAEEQLLQREEQKADLVAAQEERSRCRAQLSELRADQPRQAVELAVLGEKQQTTQQELCSREQPSAELSGYLKTAEEALTRAKDEGTESVAEVGGLKGKLHQLQDDIRSLQEICGERAKAMAEQTCCMQQLQHEREIGITQGQNQATLVEQLQGELKSCKQAHQTDLEQLRAKLQHLQQELDVCKEKNQANLSRLQQRECTTERQSLALECLLQQCQALKDEGLYYEEVVQKQERELCQQQAQLREAQEHLAVAESSLDLYKKKYQASLTRAGELEGKVQRLEEDLQDVSSQQEATGRCSQRAVEQLTQALHATEEELCRSRQHAHHCEQTIQGLREQLAASQTQRMAAEERLVTVQAELASYTATHSHSNASYQSQAARAETLQQTLSQAEGESARHSQRAEDYQRLVQDLKLELLSVTEQKNGARKELGVLELQVQSLRQEVAAAGERQRLEVSRMQQLEDELRASRRLCAQKEQITQSQDEQLWQAHSALQERGLEVERQRAEARSLDVRLQQERAQSQAASSALREEMQLLRQSLQDSQRQQQEAARALAQQEEKLLLAQSSLQSTQGQLRQRRAEVVGLEQASHRLEAELRALQARVSSSEDEAEQSRTQLGQLRSELSQGQQAAAQLELKLRRSQEQARALQQQLQEQDASQQELREELSRRQGREDELQRQVQGAQERAGLLESERQELQRQLREQARRALQGGRSQLEEEGQRLREQLRQCSAQLESTSSSLGQAQQRLQQQAGEVTCQETALARLQEELEAAQARERQSSRRLSAAEATLQELTLTAASCHESQSQALEQLREKAQEAGALQAELVRAQQREAQLQAEKGAHEERLKRLNGELRKLQGFQQQSEQEARCCAEQLGQRNSQAQQWQRRHRASSRALAQREEELLVCKVELASLKEKLHGAVEERQRLQQDLNGLRQKFVATSSEVEALRSSLGAARSDSHRLQHESELVLANVSQWVQEQKQANEKLGHKIRAQVKHIAQLTGEKDHLQEVLVHLQQENRRLKGEVDERRIECERLKARWSSSSDVGAGLGQPWALLLGEE